MVYYNPSVILSSIQPKPTTNRTKVDLVDFVRKLLQLGEIFKVFTTSFCHKCTLWFLPLLDYLFGGIFVLVVFLPFFDSPSFREIPATQTTCESPCDQIRSFPGQGVGDEDEDPGGPHQNCSKATCRQFHSSMFFVKKTTLDPWKFTCLVIVKIRYTKLLIPGWCEKLFKCNGNFSG